MIRKINDSNIVVERNIRLNTDFFNPFRDGGAEDAERVWEGGVLDEGEGL